MARIMKAVFSVVVVSGAIATMGRADWMPHTVRQLNGRAEEIQLPAKHQMLTESWNRRVDDPYLVYMPEKDRLLMLVSRQFPYEPTVIWSDDHGASWSRPKNIHTGPSAKLDYRLSLGLSYLGDGKLKLIDGEGLELWSSNDYGETWGERVSLPPGPGGRPFYVWDPLLVDKDPSTGKVLRLTETGYMYGGKTWEPGTDRGLIRFSADGGQTWSESTQVPEWRGFNEIRVIRAKNGSLAAACRSDGPAQYRKNYFDHFCGLGVSLSRDNGATWSKVRMLYAWGRHQPSLVVMPNGDIVMSYVVRMGYPNTPEGYPQFGIEAVVSHDSGQTWDLDHRYILETWKGTTKGPDSWFSGSYATSMALLPDGSLLTAYCTGYRAFDPSRRADPNVVEHGTFDVCLVSWNLNEGPVNSDHEIADAGFDSDRRNKFDSDPQLEKPSATAGRNLALAEKGAQVRASASDEDPDFILYDPYMRKLLTLESVPAWVEITWPEAHQIDEIRIHPGAPEMAGKPSSECVPLDYRLQYRKGIEWIDLVPPAKGAMRYQGHGFQTQDREFYSDYTFAPVSAKAIRMYITRTSDTGKRSQSGDQVAVPEDKRETCLRLIEVLAAGRDANSP